MVHGATLSTWIQESVYMPCYVECGAFTGDGLTWSIHTDTKWIKDAKFGRKKTGLRLTRQICRDLIAATGLVILLKLDSNHRFFSHETLKFDWWPRKIIGHLFTLHQALCIISNPSVNSNCSCCPETLNSGQNRRFFAPCDLEIQWMILKNNSDPLLFYIKLCASFQSDRWIQTKVTVRKHSIRVKIGDLLSHVTFKFDGWPWKTLGHLFYVASSFMHHFITIGEFKLKLQSGNAQFRSKSTIFCPVWPWNLTDEWPWKTIEHLFYATSSSMHHFVAIGEFKLELQSGNAQIGSKSTIFRAVWPWNLTYDLDLLHGHHFCHW